MGSGSGTTNAGAPRARRAAPRRSASRLAAVQALYQVDLARCTTERVLEEFVLHRLERDSEGVVPGPVDRGLFADILRGVARNHEDLDNMIAGVLTEAWPLDRLEPVLHAILRAGAYELLERPDVPAPVVISEYVDIAHAFYGGKEPGLVNGVLDRLARVLRPDEGTGEGSEQEADDGEEGRRDDEVEPTG